MGINYLKGYLDWWHCPDSDFTIKKDGLEIKIVAKSTYFKKNAVLLQKIRLTMNVVC